MANGLSVDGCPWSDDNENKDKHKMDLNSLMDRLRAKNRRQPSCIEAVKVFHALSNDKKNGSGLDSLSLHKQLDTLRSSIKVHKTSYTVDRIESIARQLKLKYSLDTAKSEVSISSEIFTVRMTLDGVGIISECTISLNSDAKPCPELTKSLRTGNFDELSMHLKGLNLISDIDADKKVKAKALLSLQCLESDLNSLSKLQSTISSVQSYVHRSPLGILISRIGGLPMKLIYFVGPYDLLKQHDKTMVPMTVEAIIENGVGYSLTVGMESASPMRLQTMPLMKTVDGKSMPSFSSLSNSNSVLLPAQFVVYFEKPLVLSQSVITKIQQTTAIEFVNPSQMRPLAALLIQQITQDRIKETAWDNQTLVNLPDQRHRYFFGGSSGSFQGALVSKIPFVHPTHLPAIVIQLRQQIMFNTLLSSCMRTITTGRDCSLKHDFDVDGILSFEVVPFSLQQITTTFEHPFKESFVTIDLDLSELTAVKCKLTVCGSNDLICSNEYASRVIQRCLSLPVALRAILRKACPELKRCSLLPSPIRLPLPPRPASFLPGTTLLLVNKKSPVAESRLTRQISTPTARINVAHLLSNFTSPEIKNDTTESKLTADVKVDNKSDVEAKSNQDSTKKQEPVRTDKVVCNPMLASLLDQSGEMFSSAATTEVSHVAAVSVPSVVTAGGPLKRKRPSEWPVLPGPNSKLRMKEEEQSNFSSMKTPEPFGLSPKVDANAMATVNTSGIIVTQSTVAKLDAPVSSCMVPLKVPHSIKLETPFWNAKTELPLQTPPPIVINDGPKLENNLHKVEMGPAGFKRTPVVLKQPDLYGTSQNNSSNQQKTSYARQLSTSNPELVNILMQPCPGETMKTMNPRVKLERDDSLDLNDGRTNDCQKIKDESEPSCLGSDVHVNSSPLNVRNSSPRVITWESGNVCDNSTNCSSIDSSRKADALPKQESLDDGDDSCFKTRDDFEKPPIKVRLDKRSFLKDSPNPVLPDNFGDHRNLNSNKLSSSLSDLPVDISVDREVDILTSGGGGTSSVVPNILAGRCSSSPRLSASGAKRLDGKESERGIKRIRSSKGTSLEIADKKQKREELKKLSKKQKIYEFDDEEASGSTSTTFPMEKINTIKITNSGGKLQIQNPMKSSRPVSSSKFSSTVIRHTAPAAIAVQRGTKNLTSQLTPSPRMTKVACLNVPSRSKSESGLTKPDSKLIKTPTIKLKPLTIPAGQPVSTGVSVSQSPVVGKSTTVTVKPSSQNVSNPVGKVKVPADVKFRKGSLSLVIDNLMKKQHSSTSVSGGAGEGAVGQKEIYDAIRLEIIREGNKPSTPTREQMVAKTAGSTATSKKSADVATVKPASTSQAAPKSYSIQKLPSKSSSVGSSVPNQGAPVGKVSVATFVSTPTVSTKVIKDVSLLNAVQKTDSIPLSFTATTASLKTVAVTCTPVTNVAPDVVYDFTKASSMNSQLTTSSGVQSLATPLVTRTLSVPGNPPRMVRFNAVLRPQHPMVPTRPPVKPPSLMDARPTLTPLSLDRSMSYPCSKITEITDRLASRHFLDIMTSSSSSTTSVNQPATTSEGGVVVERLLSPPRSPSPTFTSSNDNDMACNNKGLFNRQTSESTLKVVDFSSDDTNVAIKNDMHALNKSVVVVMETSSNFVDGPAKPAATDSRSTASYQSEESSQVKSASNEQSKNSSELSTKFDNKENTGVDGNPPDYCFKAPTPKPSTARNCEDEKTLKQDAVVVRQEKLPQLKSTMHSPSSEPSSPDDSLIIDYPGTPKSSTVSSGSRLKEIACSSPGSQALLLDMSSSPSPKKPMMSPSWVKSPMAQRNNHMSPMSANSGGCDIDDDLMNEALIL